MTFILVMQVSTVLELYFNFTAVSFVSDIDDYAFKFVSKGYVTESLQWATQDIEKNKYHNDKSCKGLSKRTCWENRDCANPVRRIILFSFTSILVAIWFHIAVKLQDSGSYYCNCIRLDVHPELLKSSDIGNEFNYSDFSGKYHLSWSSATEHKPVFKNAALLTDE